MNLLTTAEVATKLRTSRRTIQRLIADGVLPVIRIGRRKNLFDEAKVEAALKKLTAK